MRGQRPLGIVNGDFPDRLHDQAGAFEGQAFSPRRASGETATLREGRQ
jgi:hypothetical protein